MIEKFKNWFWSDIVIDKDDGNLYITYDPDNEAYEVNYFVTEDTKDFLNEGEIYYFLDILYVEDGMDLYRERKVYDSKEKMLEEFMADDWDKIDWEKCRGLKNNSKKENYKRWFKSKIRIINDSAYIAKYNNYIIDWNFTSDTRKKIKSNKEYYFLETLLIDEKEEEISTLIIFEKKENLFKEILKPDWE